MFFITFAGFLAVAHLAASYTQNPPVTPCPCLDDPAIEIANVTIKDAKLGKKVKIDATVIVNQVVGESPVLQISFASSSGTTLPCVKSVLPCELKTCGGTTRTEKRLNAGWGNKCPVQPGTYTSHLAFRLPNNQVARHYLEDGNIEARLTVVDNGRVLGCVTLPLTVDVQ